MSGRPWKRENQGEILGRIISLFYQVVLSLLLLLENIWDKAKAVLRGKYNI